MVNLNGSGRLLLRQSPPLGAIRTTKLQVQNLLQKLLQMVSVIY